jgi:serine/threonine protein kinase
LSNVDERAQQPNAGAVTAIAREVLGAPASLRDGLIARRCGGDAALAAAVRAMVTAQDQATIVPDRSLGQVGAPEPSPDAPTRPEAHSRGGTAAAVRDAAQRRLGPYTILGVLGEGGMGTVYLAEQDRPRRKVALKVVRAGLVSPRLLRRFEHESQVLGRLQHPGIAQVYEAAAAEAGGFTQPYFAMELVHGVPLTDHARAKELTIAARIRLFIKVCEAVQHAHHRGVIHRDLKPGNVLVEASGQPKVLDFGVARATDDAAEGGPAGTLATEAGQVVGTIPYMSPEQISGDGAEVDTRSDVYALGVMLYELLSGRLPHTVAGKTIADAARTITGTDAPALGSIDRGLRGDLQTIAAKALEKDKARRYQSAQELADDCARFLRDEPILARPPSAVYQWKKFVRRNKAVVGGVAATFGVLVAGVVVSSTLAVRATSAEAATERALGEERDAKTRAERSADEARQSAAVAAMERDNARAVVAFLSGMLASADPEAGYGREVTVREVVDAAATSAGSEFADRPAVRATLEATLGRTYRALGRLKEAEAHGREALALLEKPHGPASVESSEARRLLAVTLSESARFDEAAALLREAEAALAAGGSAWEVDRQLTRGELGRVLLESGRVKDALPMIEETLAKVRPTLGDKHPAVMTNLDHLGSALTALGRFSEAERTVREVLALREAAYGPEHPTTAFTLTTLANLVQRSGRSEEAVTLLERVLKVRRARLDAGHPSLLVTLSNLGVAMVGAGRQREALPLLREAAEGQERTLGPEHRKALIALGVLAFCLEDLGELDEAERIFTTVVERRRRAGTLADPEAWAQFNNLAMLMVKRGRAQEADAVYREFLSVEQTSLPDDHYYLAIFRNNHGACLTALGRLDEADALLTASLPIIEKQFGPTHARTVSALRRLAELRAAQGRTDEAAALRGRIPAGK